MKTKIFLLLLLIAPNYTKAQHDYVPMAVEDATYLLYTVDYDFLPPWEDYYFGYKIKGDIEIDGQWFKKVYYRKYYSVYPNDGPAEPPLYLGDEYLIGAIRDDIPNNKVYAYLFEYPYYQLTEFNCPLNTEFLLFDFDMEVGDLFTDFCIVTDGPIISLGGIDEEFIANQTRWVYHLEYGGGEYSGIIYEGIGSDSGLFDPVWSHFEAPATIPLVYCVGEDEDCLVDYLLSDNEFSLNNSINVYPNPTKDVIQISRPQGVSIKSIQVYDLYGKLMIKKTNNSHNIEISNLKDGLYIIQVATNQGNIFKKIIKESPM